MRTNVEIDNELMAEAMKALGAKTKREAIEKALRRAVQIDRQKAALDGLGRLGGWDGDLDAMRTDRPLPEWG